MADTKITALAAIGANPINVATFPIPMVDLLDNSMAASGTTKKVTVNQILGAGGTATLASATISGDLTVDTNTLKVVSSTDSIGVGFTPSAWAGGRKAIQIGSPAQVVSSDLTLEIGSNWWHDGTNYKYTANNPACLYSPSNGSHAWYNAPSGFAAGTTIGWNTLMTLNSTGLGVGVTPSAGKGCLQLSSGINFPATQVASSDANTLDDYEEGTFTPLVRGSTVAGTGTYTNQAGFYTKVGRLVTVNVWMVWTAHTGTGFLQFSNLPFVANNTTGNYGGVSIGYQSNIASAANTVLYGLTEFGTNIVTVAATPVGGGTYGLVSMDTAGEIAFTATYFV